MSTTAVALVLGLAVCALGAPDDAVENTSTAPVAAQPAASESATREPPSERRAAVESADALQVRGTLTNRYRLRTSDDGTDQDLYQLLDLRFGNETQDRVSGSLFLRVEEDLDRAHRNERGFNLRNIDDAFGESVNVFLYSAYATIRPDGGALESVRVGRQYVYTAETFHIDGASATTRTLVDSVELKLTAYGGVPVHFYESSSSGDWLAGVRAEAEPWNGGRAALDYAHDQDRLSLLGRERNDLAAVSVWQQVAPHVDLYGQYEWLEGPRDTTLRATASLPESDFLVQASYYRLLETKHQLATEYDPYSNVIHDFVRYHQASLRASKGFGEHFDVEVGASERRLLPGESEGRFNRDVRRVYVTPSVTDLPWEGSILSVTGETYDGGGEELNTWGFDVSHRFSSRLRVSAGSDYTLYGYGRHAADERSHVRTAYLRAKFPLSSALSADVRYTWERDDVETFHAITLALVLEF